MVKMHSFISVLKRKIIVLPNLIVFLNLNTGNKIRNIKKCKETFLIIEMIAVLLLITPR